MLTLDTPIETAARLRKPHAAAFLRLGIKTAKDLLLFFPFRYLDFSVVSTVRQLRAGVPVSVQVKVTSIAGTDKRFGRVPKSEALVSDESGTLKVTWFGQGYLAKSLKPGDELLLSGTPDFFGRALAMTNPLYERVLPGQTKPGKIVPVYHLTEGLSAASVASAVSQVISLADQLEDPVPAATLQAENMPSLPDAVRTLHNPKNLDAATLARRRMAFSEVLVAQIAAERDRRAAAAAHDYVIPFDETLVKRFVAGLPFPLTKDQRIAAWEVLQDLGGEHPMNRLLLGDVGTGKTVVALIPALEAIARGYQVAVLAPTEVLAQQHWATFTNLLGKKPHKDARTVLITQNSSKIDGQDKPREHIEALIAEGMPGLYVGTHALLSGTVAFTKLALAVVDEQHRFGVTQRAQLLNAAGKRPHLLSLSATPIPRTLQLAMFGELAVSRIREKPSGRPPVTTKVLSEDGREVAMKAIEAAAKEKQQAFVITPLVQQSDTLATKAVTMELKRLRARFPKLRVEMLHGQMKPKDKEAAMKAFSSGEADVLVATTVVEVGVDVPNASVMVIEGADRFGLAQLHQLRGRVGRGSAGGTCYVIPTAGVEGAAVRLGFFEKIHDGFELSELDLKLRGSGDVFGSSQTGWGFLYFTARDADLVPKARKRAGEILDSSPDLNDHPLLKNLSENITIHLE